MQGPGNRLIDGCTDALYPDIRVIQKGRSPSAKACSDLVVHPGVGLMDHTEKNNTDLFFPLTLRFFKKKKNFYFDMH